LPRDYDASENIEQLFSRIKKMGSHPLLVTWQSEETLKFSNEVSQQTIKILMPTRNIFFRFRNNITRNSKYKQFYSTSKGIEFFKGINFQFVLKIRTDQDLPIENLLIHISSLDPLAIGEKIYTPLLNIDKPNMFYDFYYFSTLETMEKFHKIMLETKEICSNVHYDAFYRWILRKEGINCSRILDIYPRYPSFTKSQAMLMYKAWGNDFDVLPRKCWRELIWRAEEFDETSVKPTFVFSDVDLVLRREEIIKRKYAASPHIEITAIPSFFISSRFEDKIREFQTLLRRIRNRVRKIRSLQVK
jgi:hypothetical protein